MNLLDCSVPYFHTVPNILRLRPKALRVALKLHNESRNTVPDRMRHELGDLAGRVNPSQQSFMLPARLDFDVLSYAAKKTLIACYQKARYSRTPFRIVLTREQLAEAAHLSARHLRKALKELEDKRLVEVKQLWGRPTEKRPARGIQISLLDPEYGSGTALYHIAEFNRMRLDTIPPHTWYRLLLHDDAVPADTRREWSDAETEYVLETCPFCGTRKSFRIMLIPNDGGTGYARDCWYCHGCKRGGDSKRLWGLLHYYIDRRDWREALMRKQLDLPQMEQRNEGDSHQ